MTTEKGILLLATSHPYYGRMAYNLCVSIKATGSKIPVCILHQGRALAHLNESQRGIFDSIVEIDEQAFAAKLLLYKYSPFERTLFIDADTAWMPKRTPEQVFAELEGRAFQAIYAGEADEPDTKGKYLLWADVNEVRKAYDITGRIYKVRSEVMYFEKCDDAELIFEIANEVQQNPRVSVDLFFGHVPDEFCLNIALAQLQYAMNDQWQPSYWHNIHRQSVPLHIIANKYFVLSTGGNSVNHKIKKMYNSVMMAAHYATRLQYVFTLQSKKEVMPERHLI